MRATQSLVLVCELLGPEVAMRATLAGQREHDRRQTLLEQRLVEVIERLLQAIVRLGGGVLIVGHHR